MIEIERASASICMPIIINTTMSFSTKNNSQFSCKISDFGHPLSMGDWIG